MRTKNLYIYFYNDKAKYDDAMYQAMRDVTAGMKRSYDNEWLIDVPLDTERRIKANYRARMAELQKLKKNVRFCKSFKKMSEMNAAITKGYKSDFDFCAKTFYQLKDKKLQTLLKTDKDICKAFFDVDKYILYVNYRNGEQVSFHTRSLIKTPKCKTEKIEWNGVKLQANREMLFAS